MLENYTSLSSRQRNKFAKFSKIQARIQRKLDNGSFAKFSRKNREKLLSILKRYALQLKRTGYQLKIGATGSALALALTFSSSLQAQTFTERTGSANPLNGIDIGDKSAPSFIDIDSDGDFDAFIGESGGTIRYYRNNGTSTASVFAEITGAGNPFNGFDVGDNSIPHFVDINGDGDPDCFIGEGGGYLKYYEGDGASTPPTFSEQTGANNPLDGRLAVYEANNCFADLDGDGDFDAFIGGLYGQVDYYQNTGTNLAPTFTQQTPVNNPLDGAGGWIDYPTLVDVDSDGDFDAFIGDYYGNIKYYKNNGTNTFPNFSEQTGTDNPFNGVDVGDNVRLYFVDIDGDSDQDLFVGSDNGTINYFENVSAILPVELANFQVRMQSESSQLTWQTLSETNNKGFEIEHSKDGENWNRIAFVEGQGHTTRTNNYQYLHNSPTPGVNYYRLKQIDFDEKYEYSEVLSVNFSREKDILSFTIYPNPAPTGSVSISIPNLGSEKAQLEIINSIGQIISSKSITGSEINLDLHHFPKGLYCVNLYFRGERKQKQLIIQ